MRQPLASFVFFFKNLRSAKLASKLGFPLVFLKKPQIQYESKALPSFLCFHHHHLYNSLHGLETGVYLIYTLFPSTLQNKFD